MPTRNQSKPNKLSARILNYLAAFTETRFSFRALVNYRWTNNELTLDLSIFQDFRDALLQKIETGDKTPFIISRNDHILTPLRTENQLEDGA